jgi:hypothetical protein
MGIPDQTAGEANEYGAEKEGGGPGANRAEP